MPAVSLFIHNATVTNWNVLLTSDVPPGMDWIDNDSTTGVHTNVLLTSKMYHLAPTGSTMTRPQVYIQMSYLLARCTTWHQLELQWSDHRCTYKCPTYLQMYDLAPTGSTMTRPQVYIQMSYLLADVRPGSDWIYNDPTTGVHTNVLLTCRCTTWHRLDLQWSDHRCTYKCPTYLEMLMIRPQVYIQMSYLLADVPPGTDWIYNDPTTGVHTNVLLTCRCTTWHRLDLQWSDHRCTYKCPTYLQMYYLAPTGSTMTWPQVYNLLVHVLELTGSTLIRRQVYHTNT